MLRLVGIANESFVNQYFQNEDPIGKRVRWASDPGVRWMTIVGVAGDVKHFGLDLPELPAFYYTLHTNCPLETLDVCYGHERRVIQRACRKQSNRRSGKSIRNYPSHGLRP